VVGAQRRLAVEQWSSEAVEQWEVREGDSLLKERPAEVPAASVFKISQGTTADHPKGG